MVLVQTLAAPMAAITEWLWLDHAMTGQQILCSAIILTGVAVALAPQDHLHIPKKVLITGVTFGVRDNSAQTPNVALYRFAKTSTTGEQVAGADVPGAEAGVREIVPPVDASRAVVDNTQYSYVLTMFMTGWTSNTVEIIYATVTYTSPS